MTDMLPTEEELRALAQEIAMELNDKYLVEDIEDQLSEERGMEAAQYYLLGYINGWCRDYGLSEPKLRAYLKLLAVSEKELASMLRRHSS